MASFLTRQAKFLSTGLEFVSLFKSLSNCSFKQIWNATWINTSQNALWETEFSHFESSTQQI